MCGLGCEIPVILYAEALTCIGYKNSSLSKNLRVLPFCEIRYHIASGEQCDADTEHDGEENNRDEDNEYEAKTLPSPQVVAARHL